MHPFISIIIPVYNRAQVIHNTVHSLLCQTFQEFELIIIDDGSTDNLKDNLINYLNDARIQYFFQANKGVCSARNLGASLAKGDYLLFVDSDDTLPPTALNDFYSASLLQESQLLFGDVEKRKNKEVIGTILKATDPFNIGLSKGLYLTGAFSIKASLFAAVGGYDESIQYGENTELKFRILKHKPTYTFLNKVVLIYYVSVNGASKNMLNKINSNFYIIQKHSDYFKKYPRSLQLYYQNNAIAYVQLSQSFLAMKSIRKAWIANPKNIKTFIRMLLMHLPFIAKKIWKL